MARMPMRGPKPPDHPMHPTAYVEGPVGPRGLQGPKGEKGDKGDPGPKGDAAVSPSPMDIARHVRIPFDDTVPLAASGTGSPGESRALSRADHVHPAQAIEVAIEDVDGLQAALDDKAEAAHTHAIDDVTSLQTALDGKAPTSHSHVIDDTTGLQTALDGKSAIGHGHIIDDTTGLQTALDGKSDDGHGHVIDDVTGLQTALDDKQTLNANLTSVASGLTAAGLALIDDANAAAQRVTLGLRANSEKYTFRAHKNSTDQTGIVTATHTLVTFGTEVFDIGSYYDATTSRWTPPAGKYVISAQIGQATTNMVDGARVGIHLYKNGASVQQTLRAAAGVAASQSAELLAVVDANGTDYFEIYAFFSGAGDKTITGLPEMTFFQGFEL